MSPPVKSGLIFSSRIFYPFSNLCDGSLLMFSMLFTFNNLDVSCQFCNLIICNHIHQHRSIFAVLIVAIKAAIVISSICKLDINQQQSRFHKL